MRPLFRSLLSLPFAPALDLLKALPRSFVLLLVFGSPLAQDHQDRSDTDPSSAEETEPEEEESNELSAVSRRNENVAVYQIDTNALKELDKRVGVRLTAVADQPIERNFYATEFGQPPRGVVTVGVPLPTTRWRGQIFTFHQNSVLNARSFFQVGEVKPSRTNHFGGMIGGPINPGGIHRVAARSTRVLPGRD